MKYHKWTLEYHSLRCELIEVSKEKGSKREKENGKYRQIYSPTLLDNTTI